MSLHSAVLRARYRLAMRRMRRLKKYAFEVRNWERMVREYARYDRHPDAAFKSGPFRGEP